MIRRWLPLVLCLALILTLGTPLFSIVRTSAIVDPLVLRISPDLSAERFYELQVLLRRGGHFAEYAILFLFLNLGPLRGRPLFAFLVSIGCASIDETLQYLTPGRSGEVSDVALDASGPATMLLVAMPHWDRLHHSIGPARRDQPTALRGAREPGL